MITNQVIGDAGMRSLGLAQRGPQGLRSGHITLLQLKREVRLE